MLQFLNRIDYNGSLIGAEYNNFQDVDLFELVHILGVIDNLHIRLLRHDFNSESITESLRDRIFKLYEQKMLEEHEKSDDALSDTNYTLKNS